MLDFLLAAGDTDGLAFLRNVLFVIFAILSVGIVLFVLFRHTDTQGLGGAFGAGAVGGEGAFGAKSHKVADKVIAWMCGLFIVLSLIIANVSSRHASIAAPIADTTSSETTTK